MIKTIEEAVKAAAQEFSDYDDFEYEDDKAHALAVGIATVYDVHRTNVYDMLKEHMTLNHTRHGRAKVLLDRIHATDSNDEELSLCRELVDLLLEALCEGDDYYDEWGNLR